MDQKYLPIGLMSQSMSIYQKTFLKIKLKMVQLPWNVQNGLKLFDIKTLNCNHETSVK